MEAKESLKQTNENMDKSDIKSDLFSKEDMEKNQTAIKIKKVINIRKPRSGRLIVTIRRWCHSRI